MANNIESTGEVQTGKGSTENAWLLHTKLAEELLISPNNASVDRASEPTANLYKMEIVDHFLPISSGKAGGAPAKDDGHTGGGEAGAGAGAGAPERGARAAARAAAEAAAGIGRR